MKPYFKVLKKSKRRRATSTRLKSESSERLGKKILYLNDI